MMIHRNQYLNNDRKQWPLGVKHRGNIFMVNPFIIQTYNYSNYWWRHLTASWLPNNKKSLSRGISCGRPLTRQNSGNTGGHTVCSVAVLISIFNANCNNRLVNLGNTCYVNAVLQCLARIPGINDFLPCSTNVGISPTGRSDVLVPISKVFHDLTHSRQSCRIPTELLHCIRQNASCEFRDHSIQRKNSMMAVFTYLPSLTCRLTFF